MSFSITVKLDAWGNVSVEATDCLGGCPYLVASRAQSPEALEKLMPRAAADAYASGLVWSPHTGPGWEPLRGALVRAVRELAMCLPSPLAFDDDGRPTYPSTETIRRRREPEDPFARLTALYAEWMKQEGLELGSADEHANDTRLAPEQRAWLVAFSVVWDGLVTDSRKGKEERHG